MHKQNPNRAAAVDRYGELDRQVAAFRPVADEHKALKEEIASWYDDAPAGEPFVAEGNVYSVPVSARRWERTIVSMSRLFSVFGRCKFLRLCRFPLAAIDEHIPLDHHRTLLRAGHIGSRTVGRAVAKVPARKAA